MKNNKVKQMDKNKSRDVRHFVNQVLAIAGDAGFGAAYIYLSQIISSDIQDKMAQHGFDWAACGETALSLFIFGFGVAHFLDGARRIQDMVVMRRNKDKQL